MRKCPLVQDCMSIVFCGRSSQQYRRTEQNSLYVRGAQKVQAMRRSIVVGMAPNARRWVSITAILWAGGGHPLAAAYFFPPIAPHPLYSAPPLQHPHQCPRPPPYPLVSPTSSWSCRCPFSSACDRRLNPFTNEPYIIDESPNLSFPRFGKRSGGSPEEKRWP